MYMRKNALKFAAMFLLVAAALTLLGVFLQVGVSALEAIVPGVDNPGNIRGLLEVISANLTVPARTAKGLFLLAVDHCFPIRCV
jgi:hypothetical protein